MASVSGLSSASQGCVQPAYVAQVAPPAASRMQVAVGMKPLLKGFASKYTLSSKDRHIQSQFSSQAFGVRRDWKNTAVVRSTRAELAADADIGNVVDVNDAETMEKYISESGDKMVFVDVSTKTCGPCKLIFPKVVIMSREYPEVLFLRIIGDQSSNTKALMRTWGVKGVPSFRFYRQGKLIHSHVGAKEDELRAHFLTHHTPVNVAT